MEMIAKDKVQALINVHLLKLDKSLNVLHLELDKSIVEDLQERVSAMSVDAEEIKHGAWIYVRYSGMYPCGSPRPEYKCSVCGDCTMRHERKYCPECGAKMDGKDGDK